MKPGERYGLLLTEERITRGKHSFRCDCGHVFIAYDSNVASGKTRSCGCRQRNSAATILGRIDTTQPGCWEWPSHNTNGYSQVKINNRLVGAHRAVYEIVVGSIPRGMVLDHLCINPVCCRPDHLEAVTQAVNVMRSIGICAENARKTHCSNGHEFTPENTARDSRNGGRKCRACARDQARAKYWRKKQAA